MEVEGGDWRMPVEDGGVEGSGGRWEVGAGGWRCKMMGWRVAVKVGGLEGGSWKTGVGG
jgi:hypothetical protein